MQRDKYVIAGVDLGAVRNRNEIRMTDAMRQVLEEYGNPELDMETIQDAYAYAMNQLPARYVQSGTIVLGDPVRPQDIRSVAENAILRVIHDSRDHS